jgi:RNA polymerase sigma-70 factor (ECF subfamily)
MFRIAHSLWIGEIRKETVRRGGGLVQIDDAELSADNGQTPEDNMMLRDVMLAVLRLPEAQRAAVILVYVEGYSYKDAAMILDIPIGTVMSRLASARTTLGQKLKNQVGMSDAR